MLKDVHEEYNQEINNNYGHKLNQGTDVEIKNLNTNIDKVNDYKKDNLSLTKNTQVRSNKIKMTRFAEDYDSQKRNLDKSIRFSEEKDDKNDAIINNSLKKSKSENNLA